MNNFVLRRFFANFFDHIFRTWCPSNEQWCVNFEKNPVNSFVDIKLMSFKYGNLIHLKVAKTIQKVPKWCVWNEQLCVNFEKKPREFLCWHSGLKSLMHWPTPISWKNCGIKVVLGSGRKKKNVPAFYGSFSLLRRGDKKSHDHELVIEFLFRIFKQFADKRWITKKLVFLLLKTHC